MKYTCPCCGYKTIGEEPPGTYEICSICYWEDDFVQFNDPDYEGGANIPSLRQAQRIYLKFGASHELFTSSVRKPLVYDIKDPEWTMLPDIKPRN
ncbi:CPCC family cysteine-rich protein [Cytobacillus sp. IB215665]|uniref:CPCC family cysteine-rich protein n=1 Tax=Cytobacillus sp. IB215665 TaxID=3097357 RepID=UPI002A14DE50|nr:CPCC family cysteine-rich protein [Cytobacillus sp. IB215665]MDX8365532.1 CPCC family cysteine-rich protein [Cytobacillus sp. IB215665]